MTDKIGDVSIAFTPEERARLRDYFHRPWQPGICQFYSTFAEDGRRCLVQFYETCGGGWYVAVSITTERGILAQIASRSMTDAETLAWLPRG